MKLQDLNSNPPPAWDQIMVKCQEMGFDMASDEEAGSLLRALVASKPGGHFLELGTGIGASLCWMLQGMDHESDIISVENDAQLVGFVHSLFEKDPRLTLICEDGEKWLESYSGAPFDLIFADTWPGKYFCLEETLELLKPGGFYVIDDMLPQSNWPDGHQEKATQLVKLLNGHDQLFATKLDWSTGVMISTKKFIP